jgi:hypothetical protein
VFDAEDTLTHEEVLIRFKRVIGRDMTPEERCSFFLPPELPANPQSVDSN